MDTLTKAKRSWNMSRIKGKDTKPELKVRSLLHRLGFRFRLHSKKLPGKPDLVLPKYQTVIFVHGCFWHRHHGCKYSYTPKSRAEFWKRKFNRTKERDASNVEQLLNAGWDVITIWECETKKHSDLLDSLAALLQKKQKTCL